MELARLALALVALTCFLAGTASAQTQADFSAALDHKQDAVNEFKLSLERRVFKKWYRHPDNINDPGWVRNSPLRNELVDLLNDATKAMGGWPRWNLCCCLIRPLLTHEFIAPMLVEPFNKVCEKFNDAKLFDMGLQCRAGIYTIKDWYAERAGPVFCVLVEKKSDEKLRDVGDTLNGLWYNGSPNGLVSGLDSWRPNHPLNLYPDPRAEAALTWSPPEDWMTRLTPPYNETTNHV